MSDKTDAERIREAVGYDPVLVSLVGQRGGWTYRTVQDRDAIVEAITPLLAEVRTEVRREIAGRIFRVEQDLQRFIEADPTNPRLAGAVSALQHARQIAEGVTP